MSIFAGDKIEVQDRSGVAELCVDGEQFHVLINNNGLLTVEGEDGFSSFNIPATQVKKVKENRNSQLVNELYDQSDSVNLYIYDVDIDKAKLFVSNVNKPQFDERNNVKWYSASKDKITATAFLKGDD
ncbi:hypothetical protein [Listeria monocytogenes]|uniref:Uncharacterized protein n=2 Tax=root TaxID=1 RepID=A0A7D4XJV0_9CAUD|nr:hypothetical protein [Listeria monocytogenes]YP_009907750.1 hypothetical protein H2675_gp17 [Listeria phage LP-HM00113468]EAG6256117.1 hypothetical protein [Listeria monocytogenes CFSAN003807]APV01658.1 hypothetical protein BWI18_08870 [Listeria monocytogenes]EAC2566526.1 hypothetical protein [Listeria monocytogenes]EAC2859764.1 hypothetical protein [Listeria monocytogenes]EAC3374834.1 hypothetical protein [Listeria monocytogenes]